MDTLDTKNEQKTSTIFWCKKCDYKCSRKSNFIRHVSTDKHRRIHLDTKNEQNEQNEQKNKYQCYCGKIYHFSQGLSKHKKICTVSDTEYEKIDESDKTDVKHLTSLVIEVVKQNQELTKQICELSKNGIVSNNINIAETADHLLDNIFDNIPNTISIKKTQVEN
jgi:hypothetical protein